MKKQTKTTRKARPKKRLSLTAKNVLAMRFISHVSPLALAKRWLHSGDKAQRKEARLLLEGLFTTFGYSVDVGQLLVLACFEDGQERRAKAVLDKLSLLCRNPHEEIQSRLGRLYREQGDRYVPYPGFDNRKAKDSASEALRYYLLALEEYQKAYEIRHGHYPGINVATLHFLVAAFEPNPGQRDRHLKLSKELARELLDGRESWPADAHDDDVWHAATQGESHLLLGNYDEAAACYRRAVEHSLAEPFHQNAMRKQVVRIVYCYQNRLKTADLGPFEDWEKLFV